MASELADFEVYRAPMPLQHTTVPGGGPSGTFVERVIDPEDEPQTPEPEPRRVLAR